MAKPKRKTPSQARAADERARRANQDYIKNSLFSSPAPKPKPATTQVRTVGGVKPNAKAKAPKAGRGGQAARDAAAKAAASAARAELVKKGLLRASGEESVQQKAPDPVDRAAAVERARMESFAQYLSTLKEEQAADPTEAARVAREKAAAADVATGRGKRPRELAAMRAAQKAARAAGATEDEVFARRQLEDYRKRTGIDLLPKKVPPSSKASSHKPKQPKSVVTPDMGEHRAARAEMSPAERRAAPPLPRQPKQSGGKQNLVMTPRQIKRRAERARKGKG